MSTRSQIAWFLGGALCVIAVALGVVAWQFRSLRNWQPPKDWSPVGPIAVSPRWSIMLEQKARHPFLAEYDYRLRVFSSKGREGDYRGTIDLLPNSGGRTFLCVSSLTAAGREPILEVADRMDTSIVDLEDLRRLPSAPIGYERRFIGAFVEVAAPLRFVPSQIDPTCPLDR
jgi:hypothetical protein